MAVRVGWGVRRTALDPSAQPLHHSWWAVGCAVWQDESRDVFTTPMRPFDPVEVPMPEPILVRLCTEDDLPVLGRREPHPKARYAEGHFQRQQEGDYLFAIAVRDHDLLGSSVLDCREDNRLQPELKSLWVYPEFRRHGAARALTRFLEGQALDRGFDEIFLRVDPQNVAAIPMYISLDYTPTGDHRLTTYEYVDGLGNTHSREEMDAIYRKSLRLLRQ